jgi:hypothetical protein
VKANYYYLVIFPILVLGGCATYNDLGNGRYDVTRTTEMRSPFGTNMGFAKVENCEGVRVNPGSSLEFRDCRPVTDWVPMSSQGQGGQIVSGALTGVGAGVGGAMVNTGNSVIQNLTTTTVNGTDEDGYKEMAKRSALKKAKKECQDALARNDWAALAAATTRLRDLSAKP